MFTYLLIILAIGAVILYHFISLRQDYSPKDFWIFISLTVLGIGLNVAQIFGAKIPNPNEYLAWLYQPLTDLLMKFLE